MIHIKNEIKMLEIKQTWFNKWNIFENIRMLTFVKQGLLIWVEPLVGFINKLQNPLQIYV
jgi:hypothetical protein